MLSAANLHKQFEPRSDLDPNRLTLLIPVVFLKGFFEKGNFEKYQQATLKKSIILLHNANIKVEFSYNYEAVL